MKRQICFLVGLILFLGFARVVRATDNVGGDIWMGDDGSHQRIIFNTEKVEYWNYDYPGFLHYTTDVLCTTVIGNEARFMFKVPDGLPGLSGLYIVSYVKDNGKRGIKNLYEHSGTLSYIIAKEWCESGFGYSPTGYSLNYGDLSVR